MWIVLHLLLLLQSGACTGAYNLTTQTVGPGQKVSLTCLHGTTENVQHLIWIRLVSGSYPEILATTASYDSGSVECGTSNTGHRITAKKEQGTFVLQISQVEKSDTAIYYCLKVNFGQFSFLKGTFLQVTEPEPSVSVVSEVQPGPPVKLQCSVLSHSGNDICQDGPKVSWFRTGPESVHPSFVYAHEECKKIKDKSTQKCVHTLSKNVNSSDAGTYLCAVVTCGRIFMGNPIRVNTKDPRRKSFQVRQIPQSKSVKGGESVTIQCSVLAESKENFRQCPNQSSVYWLKSGSGESDPHIIYSDSDDEQDPRSCVYHLSLTVLNSSDTGTYYCAVATCGQILFGQGTHVDTQQDVKAAAVLLSALLASFAVVVTVLVA
ncbi:uncharacterized protein LOC133644846 isoform X2 [Entelurus aequoreus]|uniref:uncharacterized protein LOC133644846 isoform X2 n=1 Tax=Entelurus aequoreus TaxID=161455 RepID=UPI002B1D4307|nr:uncharacterized protein LOC133644846 isoform X2 [Entelurus aequoreus]